MRGILESSHEVGIVISQPDARRGRGRRPVSPPVAEAARGEGIELVQPARIEEAAQSISEFDALVVAAYGQILRRSVLEAASRGAWNVHASLLPAYRGAAPVERAIMAGETHSGVSIMRMEEGLDTGPVALRRKVEIPPEMTGGELLRELAEVGARAIVELLDLLQFGEVALEAQDETAATYAPPITPADRFVDWRREAREVHDHIRALSPHIVARTLHPWIDGPVKLLRSRVSEHPSHLQPGEIYAGGGRIIVGCGSGCVEVTELQIPGGRPLPAPEFLRGHSLRGNFQPQPPL